MCDEVDDRVRKISKILSTYVTPLQVNVRIRCELIILMLLFCNLSKYLYIITMQ